MSLEDPFFAVKDEVFKALNKTRGLYLRWRELGGSNDGINGGEAEWTTNELKNSLRSIEWDLEDLEDTISIVEKNSHKFRIDSKELRSRRYFIDNTRDEVKQMKEKMSLNRSKDRDITAHQPLLDEHYRQQQQIAKDSTNNNTVIVDHEHQQQQQQLQYSQQQHYQEHLLEQLNHHQQLNHSSNHQTSKSDRSHLADYSVENLVTPTQSSAGGQSNSGLPHNCSTLLNGGSSVSAVSGVMANTLAGTMAAVRHSGTKYSKLENTLDSPGHYHNVLDSPTHRFIGDTVNIQQRMLQNQDEQLEMISDSIGTLKTVSRQIGVELDEQAIMLDDFGNEFEITESKLDATMKKIAKVLHMNNDKSQWAAIIVLTTLLIIVIILFIIW